MQNGEDEAKSAAWIWNQHKDTHIIIQDGKMDGITVSDGIMCYFHSIQQGGIIVRNNLRNT